MLRLYLKSEVSAGESPKTPKPQLKATLSCVLGIKSLRGASLNESTQELHLVRVGLVSCDIFVIISPSLTGSNQFGFR